MQKKKWMVMGLLMFFLFSLWPLTANAQEPGDYNISTYDAYVSILPDGSVYFDEYITYNVTEDEVLIEKPINMSAASEMLNLEIFQMDSRESAEEDAAMNAVLPSETGEEGTYRLSDIAEEMYTIQIPVLDARQQTTTYVFRYRLNDVIFLYRDTAVFFWQFLLPENGLAVENIQVTVTPPEWEGSDELMGFYRGALYVEKEIIEESILRVEASQVQSEEYLEVALLMPPDLIPDGRKIIDNFAREAIITEMMTWEDNAEQIRQEMAFRTAAGWTLAGLTSLLVLGTGGLLLLKSSKKSWMNTQRTKIAELPNDGRTPAEVSAVYENGSLGSEALFATLLHLIHRRCLLLTSDENGVGSISLWKEFDTNTLKPHEEYLLDWLIKDLGDGSSAALLDVDRLFNEPKSVNRFQYKFTTWARLIQKKGSQSKKQNDFTKSRILGLAVSVIGLVSAYMAGILLENQTAGIIAAIVSVLLAVYTMQLKNTVNNESLEAAQWESFKDFLGSQIVEDPSHLPLAKWELYMVYAIPLNMGGEILKGITQAYPQQAFEDGNLTYLYASHHEWLQRRLDFSGAKRKRK